MTHRELTLSAALDRLTGQNTTLVPSPVEVGERWPVIRTGERQPIPTAVRRLIWHRDGRRCRWCGRGDVPLQLDHIVPWSAGGPDVAVNLRLLCEPCNTTRSNYRTATDTPATPATLACDTCIREWIRQFGYSRYGRCIPANPEITVFCGNCMDFSHVTDPARLK